MMADAQAILDEIAQFVRGAGGYPVPETREGTDHPTDDAGWVQITLPYDLTRRLFAVTSPPGGDTTGSEET